MALTPNAMRPLGWLTRPARRQRPLRVCFTAGGAGSVCPAATNVVGLAKTSNVQAEETCGFVQVRCGDMTAGVFGLVVEPSVEVDFLGFFNVTAQRGRDFFRGHPFTDVLPCCGVTGSLDNVSDRKFHFSAVSADSQGLQKWPVVITEVGLHCQNSLRDFFYLVDVTPGDWCFVGGDEELVRGLGCPHEQAVESVGPVSSVFFQVRGEREKDPVNIMGLVLLPCMAQAFESNHVFPSISVDRGFFFTLIMRVVVGVRVVWRAGRLTLGTPRESAGPILPATVGYFVSSRAGSSAGLVSLSRSGVSKSLPLVNDTEPLTRMMFSALITTPLPGMSDALCVCDAPDAIGAVFGPYPHKVRVLDHADMALLIALINRKMISIISPFGIVGRSTSGIARTRGERTGIFPLNLTSAANTHILCVGSSRVLVKKGRHHQWWCGSPRFPLRRAGMGRVGAGTSDSHRPAQPNSGPCPVRRKEVAS